jgi:hypothetical protein
MTARRNMPDDKHLQLIKCFICTLLLGRRKTPLYAKCNDLNNGDTVFISMVEDFSSKGIFPTAQAFKMSEGTVPPAIDPDGG